jgi:hypothetical protein
MTDLRLLGSVTEETFNGRCLNSEQQLAVKNSIVKIYLNENLRAKFWGKVIGAQKDYIIVRASILGSSIENHFYFRYVPQQYQHF